MNPEAPALCWSLQKTSMSYLPSLAAEPVIDAPSSLCEMSKNKSALTLPHHQHQLYTLQSSLSTPFCIFGGYGSFPHLNLCNMLINPQKEASGITGKPLQRAVTGVC